jgi:hypothetical protein
MTDILESVEHAYWGRMQRRAGYDGWDIETVETIPDGKGVRIRVEFDDPNDGTVQANYSAIRERWGELWPRILQRTQEMKSRYGYADVLINGASDWFSLCPPRGAIDEGAEWSVMLQADEAGWLLAFKGWDDFGGQGVF